VTSTQHRLIHPGGQALDYLAALQVIITEAGGRFTSLEGETTPGGGSVVCTNGHLHDEVLAQLRATG